MFRGMMEMVDILFVPAELMFDRLNQQTFGDGWQDGAVFR